MIHKTIKTDKVLKPCRFCGCPDPKVIVSPAKDASGKICGNYYAVQCQYCGSRSGWKMDLARTVEVWNGECHYWADGHDVKDYDDMMEVSK